MDKIKIAITGRVASVVALPEVVADNAEYEVDFALDPREGWDMSLPITALFVRRDGSYTARILDAGATSCTMPPQTGTNIVFVGLTQDDLRTTTPATIKVRRSIRTVANDPLPAPTEDVYAQILEAYAGVKILSGKGAPTSATQGKVNQLYRDEDTQKLYICTATDGGGYTWSAVVSDTEDAVTYTAQTLTEEQKTQARANIGAGTSNFSGSYNDLNDQPNIPAATVIDTTLTKPGQAADAKAAGDAIGKKIDAPQVAQVGEVLTVEAVDAEGKPTKWKTAPAAAEQKQSDWNQNDNAAAGYVKNRTHYEESIYVDYVLNMSETEIVGLSMPEVGETMTVKINGVDSAETVKEAESSNLGTSYKYIGNIDFDSLINGGTGWCVIALPGVALGFANADTTITVEDIVVHKINDKFINFDGFVRTFDYYFKTSTVYKTFYNDNGDECLLYMCDKFILPKMGSQLFGFMEETGFSKVGGISEHSCFVTGFIINIQYGSITVKKVVLGTDTSEMELNAANYGYTLTTNPKA